MHQRVGAVSRLPRILAAAAIPLCVAAAAFTLAVGLPSGDADMWWHLASGRWIVEHRELLRVDVFSSTATGEPYALGEPLGEVVLWLAYASGSWTGVAILRAALVALAAFSLTRLALRAAPARVAIPLVAAALVLSKPTWTDRPQLWTLALFPLVLDLALAARAGSRGARIALVPIVAVWAELHGGYALGLGVLWMFALEALLTRRPLVVPVAVAVAVTLIVPFEPGALSPIRALAHVGGSTVRIVEESPVDALTPFGALFALFVAVTLVAFMLRGGSLLAALVIVPTLLLALSAQRHVPLFGFAVVPFIAGPVTEVAALVWRSLDGMVTTRRTWRTSWTTWRKETTADGGAAGAAGVAGGATSSRRGGELPSPGTSSTASPRATARAEEAALRSATSSRSSLFPPLRSSLLPPLPLALAGALWIGAIASIATADPRPDLSPYPTAALPALEASSGVVLNEYDWGGYLIWNAPERPVFVDGRLYPFTSTGVMDAYRRAVAVLPGWRGVLERWGVRQALLRPDRALVAALGDDGWTVVATGPTFVLLERPR